MKKIYKLVIAFFISILCVFNSSMVNAFDKKDEYIKEYKDNIYNMAKIMRCIPKTGDLNLDYLYEMDFISEGEVNFSKAYIKYSTVDEVKNMAQKYIERESAAIENIRTIIERLKDDPEVDKAEEEKYLSIYNEVLNSMMCRFQKVELTEDINADFLRFILIHHNGVIELTEEFCNMSNNAEVKEVANKILNEMKSDLIVINKYI